MQLDHLLFDVSEHIATLTLNRPEARNAFSTEMRQSLATALELEAQAQSAIRSSDYHLESVKRFNRKQPLPFNWDQMDKETSTH